MKVKNIMFSGFAAALFAGVCGAASAADYTLASKGFVETQLAKKQNTLTAGSGIDITDDTISADLSTVTVKDAEGKDVNVSSALTNLSTSVAGVEEKLGELPDNTTVAAALAGKQDTLSNAEVLKTITSDDVASIEETAKAVAELETYVGTIPEGATATDVVTYVQEKTSGIASEGAMTELSNRVGLVEDDIEALESAVTGSGEGSVAQKISTALNDYSTTEVANTLYAPAALSQTVSDLLTTVANKANASDLDNYVETSAFETYQGEVTTALAGKASAQSVSDLSATVANKANASDLDNYVETSTLTAYQGEVTTALAGKAAVGASYTKAEADQLLGAKANTADVNTALAGKLDDTMTAAGTYLVQRAENGDISYVSVEIVGATE